MAVTYLHSVPNWNLVIPAKTGIQSLSLPGTSAEQNMDA
jgi:hypothetical protein